MKAIQLLVNSVLPDDLKNYEADLTDKGLNKILYAVAEKHPDKFAQVLKDISDLGRKVSYQQGETLTLDDLAPVIDRQAIYDSMEREIAALPRDKNFTQKRREIFQKYNEFIEKETSKNALAKRNNIAISVLSGARGKSAQLKAMVSTPGTFSDYKGTPVDIFSKESFADGIRPIVFLASTNGARSSVISTKCLDYQSLVKMADLSEKRLCDIQPGDMVLGADKEGKVFPVKVLNVFDQGEKECYKYTFRPSILEPDTIEPIGTVICTKDHKFLSVKHGCPLPIEEAHKSNRMRPGVKWKLSDGSVVVATEAEPIGKVHCMDIEVDHPDHLFVLANGLITSNSSTAKGGDLAKQMAQSVVDMIVRKHDCGSTNGISLKVDDESLKGRVLAQDIGPYKSGQFITREMINDLNKKGISKVVARSPLTCGVHNGLCSKCVGKFYKGGKLPKIGDAVGAMSSTAASEPVTQMALCLEENTLVRMADGTVKKLKNIHIGDTVLGADTKGNTFPVKVTDTFRQGTRKVRTYHITVSLGHSPYKIEKQSSGFNDVIPPIELEAQMDVTCTSDHKFLHVTHKAVPIGSNIVDGYKALITTYGNGFITHADEEKNAICYDIEVDHPDHLFVLANGLITSNSAKHTAGMTTSKRTYSGLGTITQFTQSPEKFKDRATVSELDGRVEDIQDAAQGGKYVTVGGVKHYIPAGHPVEVKTGDTVEAGDFLSEGLGDAEDVVRHKGLGAGRLYYANRLHKILADSGAKNDKRSIEILARGALRHVRITDDDGYGQYLPDDIVDYNVLQDSYKMPETARIAKAKDSVGKYLQAPALHYTIGTKITPRVVKDLEENDMDDIYVDEKEPQFKPEMIRLRTASHTNPDWMASLGTSYLTKQLNESAVKGDETNIQSNTDYRPRLAYGKDFGKNIETTGMF